MMKKSAPKPDTIEALTRIARILARLPDDEIQAVMRCLMAYFRVPAGGSRFK